MLFGGKYPPGEVSGGQVIKIGSKWAQEGAKGGQGGGARGSKEGPRRPKGEPKSPQEGLREANLELWE